MEAHGMDMRCSLNRMKIQNQLFEARPAQRLCTLRISAAASRLLD
jgi:hypothetical protein